MRTLWIDTDMGFDDVAAIAMAVACPDLSIVGLSLVAGNAPLDVVADNAARAVAFLGWRMPVYRGRARPMLGSLVTAANILGPSGMRSTGRTLPPAAPLPPGEDAIAALARYLEGYEPGGATILALGPLTNLAALVMARPDLVDRIGTLVWMGGSAGPGNHTAAAEFNAFVDPESVQVVIDAGVRISMVGLDACRPVTVGVADAETVRAAGTPVSAVLGDLLEGYARLVSADGSRPQPLYDPVAAAAVVDPASVTFRPAHLAIECDGRLTRGMTVVEWRVPRRAEANAAIAVAADAPRVRALCLAALGGRSETKAPA